MLAAKNPPFTQATVGVASSSDARYTKAAQWIVLLSLSYQAILCAVHTNLHQTSTTVVIAAEFVIFLACLAILATRSNITFIALTTGTIAYLLLFCLLRDHFDPKGFRDVLIPLFFFELGRQRSNQEHADHVVNIAIFIVLAFALFELLFLSQYSKVFNILSYYISQGNIQPGAAWAGDSVLSLNGIRPEGIGRTILPALLGSHRVSSIFLEPVSLGNFAVIVACWALAKPASEYKKTIWLLLASIVLIALSDSRYGMLSLAILFVARFILPKKAEVLTIFTPLLCVAALMLIAANYGQRYNDDIMGRLFLSGHALLDADLDSMFGLGGPELNLGDMGYPAMLLHLGLPLCVMLWVAFWAARMKNENGNRLRAYATIYMSLILCVSGSSMFAMKSAGFLWFLLGSCAVPKHAVTRDPVDATDSTEKIRRGGQYAN